MLSFMYAWDFHVSSSHEIYKKKKNLDALEHIPQNIQPASYTQRLIDGAIE